MRKGFLERDWFIFPPCPIDLTRQYKFYDTVGTCNACLGRVELAPPRMCTLTVSHDNYFQIRCKNPNCHNHYLSRELFIEDIGLVDFLIFDKELLIKKEENQIPEQVIDFMLYKKQKKL